MAYRWRSGRLQMPHFPGMYMEGALMHVSGKLDGHTLWQCGTRMDKKHLQLQIRHYVQVESHKGDV